MLLNKIFRTGRRKLCNSQFKKCRKTTLNIFETKKCLNLQISRFFCTETNPQSQKIDENETSENPESQPEKMYFHDELWDSGLKNKEKAVKMGQMIGYNEKFFKEYITLNFKAGTGGTGAISHEPDY